MNDMRKLMEAVDLSEDASTEATAYIIYRGDEGYYQSPGYYTGNLALAKTYARLAAAEKQKAAYRHLENSEIWEVRITEIRRVK